MALVNCAECGTQISNQAASCIKCGAPLGTSTAAAQPKKTSTRNYVIGGVIGVCVMAALYVGTSHHSSPSTTGSPTQANANTAPDTAPVSSSSDGSGISADAAAFIPVERQMDAIRKSIKTASIRFLDDFNKVAELDRQKDPRENDFLQDWKNQVDTMLASCKESETLQLPSFQDARHAELAQNALANLRNYTRTKKAMLIAFKNHDFDEAQRLDNQAYVMEGEFTHSLHLMNQSLGLEPAPSK